MLDGSTTSATTTDRPSAVLIGTRTSAIPEAVTTMRGVDPSIRGKARPVPASSSGARHTPVRGQDASVRHSRVAAQGAGDAVEGHGGLAGRAQSSVALVTSVV